MASTITLKSDAYDGRYMQLTCTQRKDAEKSYIDWTLSSIGGTSSYYSTGPTIVTINGTQVYYKDRVDWSSKSFPAKKGSTSGTIAVEHDAEGNKTISVSLKTVVYNGASRAKTYSNDWTLDPIPRKAKIQNAPSNFTNATSPTITYTNPLQSNASYLGVCIADSAGLNVYADYRDLEKTGTSYIFTLSDADKVALNNKVGSIGGSNNKLDVMFVIKTTANGKDYYDGWSSTYEMVETDDTKPRITQMTVAVNNPPTVPPALANTYIQGKSKIDVSFTAETRYKADVVAYSAKVDTAWYSSPTNPKVTIGEIRKEGSAEVTGRVRDSRDFIGEEWQYIYVLAYSKPLVIPLGSENAILCYRSDENGKIKGNSKSVWIKAKRSYYNLGGKNGCSLQWRWKRSAEVWNDNDHKWADLIPKTTTSTDEYNALVSGEFLLNESYSVQIRATDDLGESDVKDLEVPTQDVALHLGEGGKQVTVGDYCEGEDYTFRSAWRAIFDKGMEGSIINKYAADVLAFAMECPIGLTPFVTRATSVNLPPEGQYDFSAGVVHRRSDTQINVYLTDYFRGTIATNTYLEDDGHGWLGWKYILLSLSPSTETGWIELNSFTKYRRKQGFVTVSAYCDGDLTLTQNQYTVIGTLPEGYRPSTKIPIVYNTIGGTMDTQAGVINTGGTIELYTETAGKNYWAFSVTYPI